MLAFILGAVGPFGLSELCSAGFLSDESGAFEDEAEGWVLFCFVELEALESCAMEEAEMLAFSSPLMASKSKREMPKTASTSKEAATATTAAAALTTTMARILSDSCILDDTYNFAHGNAALVPFFTGT